MQRREFVTTLGAIAAVAGVAPAFAAESTDHAKHAHPALYKALSQAASKCVASGEDCMRHNFGMLSMNDTSMADCTKATYDTIAACRALITLASVNSPFTAKLAKVVEEVCAACKKECDKFPQYPECVDMGEACKACADECKKVAA
jgi:Cys-rich four helix bundle protein (predicted Tat secretion target)